MPRSVRKLHHSPLSATDDARACLPVMLAFDTRRGTFRALLREVVRLAARRSWAVQVLGPDTPGNTLGGGEPSYCGVIAGYDDGWFPPGIELGQVPSVLIQSCHNSAPAPANVSSVVSDVGAIAATAAKYFLRLGYREVAFVGPPQCGPRAAHSSLGAAMLEAADQARVPCHMLALTAKQLYEASGRGRLGQWLYGLPQPVGVLCATDLVGRLLLQACQQVQLLVPSRVAVLAPEQDRLLCEICSPALSSIPPNVALLAEAAAELLEEALYSRGSFTPREVRVPPSDVIERDSTRPFTINDPDVDGAVGFIREHLHESITVGDVADAVGLSRATLKRRFAASRGRTVSREIRLTRLQYACELLASTDLTVPEIVKRVGFGTVQHLASVFRDEYETTMYQYRKRFRP